MTAPREVTAETLTNEQIRQWESDELHRRRSVAKRREAVDSATDALMTGIQPGPGTPISPERRIPRARIAAEINARAKAGAK